MFEETQVGVMIVALVRSRSHSLNLSLEGCKKDEAERLKVTFFSIFFPPVRRGCIFRPPFFSPLVIK